MGRERCGYSLLGSTKDQVDAAYDKFQPYPKEADRGMIHAGMN